MYIKCVNLNETIYIYLYIHTISNNWLAYSWCIAGWWSKTRGSKHGDSAHTPHMDTRCHIVLLGVLRATRHFYIRPTYGYTAVPSVTAAHGRSAGISERRLCETRVAIGRHRMGYA